jgi:hypothetical protein
VERANEDASDEAQSRSLSDLLSGDAESRVRMYRFPNDRDPLCLLQKADMGSLGISVPIVLLEDRKIPAGSGPHQELASGLPIRIKVSLHCQPPWREGLEVLDVYPASKWHRSALVVCRDAVDTAGEQTRELVAGIQVRDKDFDLPAVLRVGFPAVLQVCFLIERYMSTATPTPTTNERCYMRVVTTTYNDNREPTEPRETLSKLCAKIPRTRLVPKVQVRDAINPKQFRVDYHFVPRVASSDDMRIRQINISLRHDVRPSPSVREERLREIISDIAIAFHGLCGVAIVVVHCVGRHSAGSSDPWGRICLGEF